MAHILVYLQRTPYGLHPGSALSLCWARDLASARGASVTAVLYGDAGSFDEGIYRAAARFGGDSLVVSGQEGLLHLYKRLRPTSVLVPNSAEGLQVAATAGLQPIPRWLDSRRPGFGGPDAVTAVSAGTLPWHMQVGRIEPDFEGDATQVPLPDWIDKTQAGPGFLPIPRKPMQYLSAGPLDATLQTRLSALGAESLPPGAEPGELLLCFDVLPDRVSPRTRVLLSPKTSDMPDPTWSRVDFVLGGARLELLETLRGEPWTSDHA